MNKQHTSKTLLHKIGGYYLIPHELLHVWACRLINQPCRYQWGDHSVKPMAKMTRNERLFVLLFPFVACWLAALILHLLWGVALIFLIKMPLERYFFGAGPTWHVVLPVVATLLILYSGSGYGDVIQAYRLLPR